MRGANTAGEVPAAMSYGYEVWNVYGNRWYATGIYETLAEAKERAETLPHGQAVICYVAHTRIVLNA